MAPPKEVVTDFGTIYSPPFSTYHGMSHSKRPRNSVFSLGGAILYRRCEKTHGNLPTWGLPALVREPIRPIPKSSPPPEQITTLFRTFQKVLLRNGKSSGINISINNKTVKFWKVMTFVFSTLLLRKNHTFSSPLPTGRNDLHRFAICFPEMKHTSHKKVIRKEFFDPQQHPTLVSFPDPASQIEPTRFSPEKKRSMPLDRSSPAR